MSKAFLNQDDTLTVEEVTVEPVSHDQWETEFAARLAEREQRASCTCGPPLILGGFEITRACTATAHRQV